MRNVLAVMIGAAVGVCATTLAIAAFAMWTMRIGPSAAMEALSTVPVYAVYTGLPFIGCLPGGLVAALIATPPWCCRCAVLAGILTWLIIFLLAAIYVPESPWALAMSGFEIAGLLGSLSGGLVGGILYEKVSTKFVRQEQ